MAQQEGAIGLLGVISDTHGRLGETRKAIRLFREHQVDKIIHCGDIGGGEIVRAFEGIETHFVFGNTDGENELLRLAAMETGNTLHGWFGSLNWLGCAIAFLHSHQHERFSREVRSGVWNLVCFGHTHQPTHSQHGNTRLLNPGAFERVATPRVAIVSIPTLDVESLIVK